MGLDIRARQLDSDTSHWNLKLSLWWGDGERARGGSYSCVRKGELRPSWLSHCYVVPGDGVLLQGAGIGSSSRSECLHSAQFRSGGRPAEPMRRLPDTATCIICMDTERATVSMPCTHSVCCLSCASETPRCFICRAAVAHVSGINLS